jgi:hypothetical protein
VTLQHSAVPYQDLSSGQTITIIVTSIDLGLDFALRMSSTTSWSVGAPWITNVSTDTIQSGVPVVKYSLTSGESTDKNLQTVFIPDARMIVNGGGAPVKGVLLQTISDATFSQATWHDFYDSFQYLPP